MFIEDKKKSGFTLIEIIIAAVIFAIITNMLYIFYTKVVVGTVEGQDNLLHLTSKARLASRVINWELTNAHYLISPLNKDDVQRTDSKLIYYDANEALCVLKIEKGILIKRDLTYKKEKVLVSGVDEVYFTRLDKNLVQFRIVVKSKKRRAKVKKFQVVGSVFVTYSK